MKEKITEYPDKLIELSYERVKIIRGLPAPVSIIEFRRIIGTKRKENEKS